MNKIETFIESIDIRQKSLIGYDVYLLSVLKDVFNPTTLFNLRPKVHKDIYKKIVRVTQLLDRYGFGTFSGSFECILESIGGLFGANRLYFELSNNHIELTIDKATISNEVFTDLSISTLQLNNKELNNDILTNLLAFHRILKSTVESNFTIDAVDRTKLSKHVVEDRRKEDYESNVNTLIKGIVADIIKGSGNWEMPWHKGIPEAWNPVSGIFYSGVNQLILWRKCTVNDYEYNQWATFKQWNKKGVKIRRGEKGTLIQVRIPVYKDSSQKSQLLLDQDTDDMLNGDEILYYKDSYFTLYNIKQVTGINPNQISLFSRSNTLNNPELMIGFINRTGAQIIHKGSDAFYDSITDTITMPHRARFNNLDLSINDYEYYSTLLHELIHWTGHTDRCNRSVISDFDYYSNYAFEELVAELGASILTNRFSTKLYPRKSHAQYIENWLSALDNDLRYFTNALQHARYRVNWLYEHTDMYPYKVDNTSYGSTDVINDTLPIDKTDTKPRETETKSSSVKDFIVRSINNILRIFEN